MLGCRVLGWVCSSFPFFHFVLLLVTHMLMEDWDRPIAGNEADKQDDSFIYW